MAAGLIKLGVGLSPRPLTEGIGYLNPLLRRSSLNKNFEVEVVCRSFSMSHSMILIRVPTRIGGGQIYGHFDVYAFVGG